MALLFSEEFEGTLGSFPAGGWVGSTGAVVVATHGYHNQGAQFNPFGAFIRNTFSNSSTVTAFFAVNGPGGFILGTETVVGTNTVVTNLVVVNVGGDNSVTVLDGGTNMIAHGISSSDYKGYEGNQLQDPFGWTFVQLDTTFSAAAIGTNSGIKVVASLRLNGELVSTGTSTFGSLVNADATSIILFSGQATIKFDSIYLYNTIPSTPIVTPNPGNPKARVSQALLEYLGLPSSIDARVSQAVIEHLNLPSNSNVRISQAIIELIIVGTQGWVVYEA